MIGKPRIKPKFLRHFLFKRLLLNNFESPKSYTKLKCMIIPKWLYKIQYLQNQKYVHPGIINKLSPFTKVKLKWPLSRGNHFKIHFCLKFRKNRGSNQNFHGVPFSGDCKIITSGHTIISYLLLTHAIYIKTRNLT